MIASRTASRQKSVVSVLESRRASTRASPNQDAEQIHEASPHRSVGDVRRPDVTREPDLKIFLDVGFWDVVIEPVDHSPTCRSRLASLHS